MRIHYAFLRLSIGIHVVRLHLYTLSRYRYVYSTLHEVLMSVKSFIKWRADSEELFGTVQIMITSAFIQEDIMTSVHWQE